MKTTIGLLFLVLLAAGRMSGQKSRVEALKGEIAFYADVVVNADDSAHRLRANASLKTAMDSLLALPGSFQVSLDSIRWLSVLHGDDFRIVTWQIRVSDEEYKYDGFIQMPDRLVALRDSRPFINGSSYNTYTPAAWYGCLYYKIYPFDRKGKKYYMLLGFNAENSTLNIKIADILDLTGPDPKFGVPVFTGKEGDPMTRILLTYADLSTVYITFDESVGGIVYDHIENLEGIGPAGEALPVSDGSLEGWILKNGDWVYQEKVHDVKSEAPPMLESRKNRKEDRDILGRPRK